MKQISVKLAGVFAVVAFALTVAAPVSAAYTFSKDLTIGSRDADVTALQTFLESKGVLTIPAGVSKGYFGDLTRAALAKYQMSKGITPAVGYFGPITRAAVNGESIVVVPGTPGTPGNPSAPGSEDLSGGAGDIEAVDFISGLNSEEVGEDEEDVEIVGWEIEASEGSDIAIRAITLDFDKTSNGANSDDDLEDYAAEVSVWFEGEEVARMDADEFDDDNDYRKSITLDSGVVINEEEVGDLVVAVSGVSNLDSANEGETWTAALTSVRFEDAQGAVITVDDVDDMDAGRTFSFESFASASNVELNASDGDDTINDSRVIKVENDEDTDNIEIFSFELEAEGDSDIEVKDLAILFTSVGAEVDALINSAELFIGGESVGSENITSTTTTLTVVFDDIDYMIDAGDTVEVILAVDFNEIATTSGKTLKAELSKSASDIEDEQGNEVDGADFTGSASSEAHTLNLSDVVVSDVSSDVSKSEDDKTGYIAWTFTIDAEDGAVTFDVANNNAVNGSTDGIEFTVTGTDTSIAVSTLTLLSGDATYSTSTDLWTIADGDDATFVLDTTLTTATSTDNGTYRVRLDYVAGQKIDKTSSSVGLQN